MMLLTLNHLHHSFLPACNPPTFMAPKGHHELQNDERDQRDEPDDVQRRDELTLDDGPPGNLRTYLLPPSSTTPREPDFEQPVASSSQLSTVHIPSAPPLGISTSQDTQASTSSYPQPSPTREEEAPSTTRIPRAPNTLIHHS